MTEGVVNSAALNTMPTAEPEPNLPPEKVRPEKKIPLVECFGPTVSGEGAVIGQITWFLRFGLCDYECARCDSMHAVDPRQVKANAEWLTQGEIFERLDQHLGRSLSNAQWVTFSGGNPCIHELSDLVGLCQQSGWQIAVETQGTFCPDWLWGASAISVSPKGPGMGEKLELDKLDKFIEKMQEHPGLYIKFVVFDQRDIEVASMLYERYVTAKILWPDQFFLSLGNPYPPGSGEDFPMEYQTPAMNACKALLHQYECLLPDVMADRNLCNARFLPQFHVLLWGNKQGV